VTVAIDRAGIDSGGTTIDLMIGARRSRHYALLQRLAGNARARRDFEGQRQDQFRFDCRDTASTELHILTSTQGKPATTPRRSHHAVEAFFDGRGLYSFGNRAATILDSNS